MHPSLLFLPAALALMSMASCSSPRPSAAPSTGKQLPAWSVLRSPEDPQVMVLDMSPSSAGDGVSCRAQCDAHACMAVPYLAAEVGRTPAQADGGPTAIRQDLERRQVDPGVRLQASATRLLVRLDQPLLVCVGCPLDYLLVRWWLNHRPIQPSSSDLIGGCNGGQELHISQFDITLTQTLESLGAHDGDIIDVQVLVCPAGCSPAIGPDPELAEPIGVDLRPRMSQVVEFQVRGTAPVHP